MGFELVIGLCARHWALCFNMKSLIQEQSLFEPVVEGRVTSTYGAASIVLAYIALLWRGNGGSKKLREMPEVPQLVSDVYFPSLLGERPFLEVVGGGNGKGHSLESKELQNEGEQAVCLGIHVSTWGYSMRRQPYVLYALPSGDLSHFLIFSLIPYCRNYCSGPGGGGLPVPLPGR